MTVIETIRDLLEKATPELWAGDGSELRGGKDYQRSMAEFWSDAREVDVELVCMLRNHAPALLRVVEAARACYEEDDFITVAEEGDGRHERDQELGAALEALVRGEGQDRCA